MLVDAPLDGTGGEVELEIEGLGDTVMGSPYLALDIRDAGDVYDLDNGAFYFKWSGKWADFVGVGDIGDDACFRVQPTLLDGISSIKVVDGATLSTFDIRDPRSTFSICALVEADAEESAQSEADTLMTATYDESDASQLNTDSDRELPASCLEILARMIPRRVAGMIFKLRTVFAHFTAIWKPTEAAGLALSMWCLSSMAAII